MARGGGGLLGEGQARKRQSSFPTCSVPELVLNCSPIGVRPFWPGSPLLSKTGSGQDPQPSGMGGAQFQEKQCRWHPVLWLQPGAALRLGASDAKGRRLLFVAILRTLGVPARLNPVDGQAQYWNGAAFVTVEAAGPAEPMATLTIQFPEPLTYNLGWTLSRWAGGWQTLDLSGEPGPVYRLPLGQYRLMTVNRLPTGTSWPV